MSESGEGEMTEEAKEDGFGFHDSIPDGTRMTRILLIHADFFLYFIRVHPPHPRDPRSISLENVAKRHTNGYN